MVDADAVVQARRVQERVGSGRRGPEDDVVMLSLKLIIVRVCLSSSCWLQTWDWD